jgi:hypothetical protein
MQPVNCNLQLVLHHVKRMSKKSQCYHYHHHLRIYQCCECPYFQISICTAFEQPTTFLKNMLCLIDHLGCICTKVLEHIHVKCPPTLLHCSLSTPFCSLLWLRAPNFLAFDLMMFPRHSCCSEQHQSHCSEQHERCAMAASEHVQA